LKGIEIKSGRVYYYGNPAGYVENAAAVLDNLFRCRELECWLDKRGIGHQWKDGVYDRLSSGSPAQTGEFPEPLKSCRIWQLKPEVDVMMKFVSYDELTGRFGEPDPENYSLVYDGQIETNELEDIWTKFNIRYPVGFSGHSLSMSDVIELYDCNGSEFHYVDRYGFKQIGFESQKQYMSMSM